MQPGAGHDVFGCHRASSATRNSGVVSPAGRARLRPRKSGEITMSKFMILYRAPESAADQIANATPEQRQAGLEAWRAWATRVDYAIADLGHPACAHRPRRRGRGQTPTASAATRSWRPASPRRSRPSSTATPSWPCPAARPRSSRSSRSARCNRPSPPAPPRPPRRTCRSRNRPAYRAWSIAQSTWCASGGGGRGLAEGERVGLQPGRQPDRHGAAPARAARWRRCRCRARRRPG